MKKIFLCVCIVFLSFQVNTICQADLTRSQTIELKKGWNAVFLEVTPDNPAIDVVFSDIPVALLLSYYPMNTSIQYIQNPDELPWQTSSWHRWAPADRPESRLNNLFVVQAGQAYLILCTADYSWNITGEPPKLLKSVWQPDSFNFLGFYVETQTPPTFEQYFERSSAHADKIIYTLEDNIWTKILRPEMVNIQSGAAYWIWCDGGSDYPGPMQVRTKNGKNQLNFLSTSTELELFIVNLSPNPLSFKMEQIPNASGNPVVPLSIIKNSPTELQTKTYVPLTTFSPEAALEPNEKYMIRLTVQRRNITADQATALLKIYDDIGDVIYIPVITEK